MKCLGNVNISRYLVNQVKQTTSLSNKNAQERIGCRTYRGFSVLIRNLQVLLMPMERKIAGYEGYKCIIYRIFSIRLYSPDIEERMMVVFVELKRYPNGVGEEFQGLLTNTGEKRKC